MKKIYISITIIVLLIILTSIVVIYDRSRPAASPTPTPLNTNTKSADVPQTEVLAENLNVPWDIAFLPDGDILFTERNGNVKQLFFTTDKHVETIGSIDVKQVGESGLHGIALHPSFEANRYVYLYYTYSGNENNTLNRVSRFTYANGNLSDETIILDAIPGAMFHDGGRIRFGPDEFLYITTGDAQSPSSAQDTDSIAGKILRITDDGKPAPGNPFNNLVYSYGHRNPQGITWDENGNLWETEHGPSGVGTDCCRDEVNLIKPGQNYGWPDITGSETAPGMVTPLRESGIINVWAPASVAYVNGSLFFGGLRGEALYEAPINGDSITEIIPHFDDKFGRIRAVTVGPDNMLYISTSNRDGRGNPRTGDDKIIRVNPNRL